MELSDPMKNTTKICSILWLVLIIMTGCTGRKISTASGTIRGQIDLERVLSWLPADTETLQVAKGPFWMSNFVTGREDDKNHVVTTVELEKQFEGLTLGLFGVGKGFLGKHLEGKKVLFALEGSRHFRTPTGLGELPFEGCAVAIFEEDLDDRQDAYMKDASSAGARIEEFDGQRVAVFEAQQEQDAWTFYITFPEKGVVLVSTNKQFLLEMLARMHGTNEQRALPNSLHEWTYVNKNAQFWGLRHYDKQQAKYDPTSPFEGKKSANFPDEAAIGLTYQCDPKTGRRATVTYLTGARVDARKIAESRFPDAGEPAQMAALHIQYQILEPGVIQSTFDLSQSQPLFLFVFIFISHLGHGIYV
jgi:hypothetical protein